MTIAPARSATRNATFDDMVAMLRTEQTRKLDLVAPATQMFFKGGSLHLKGTEAVLTADGVDVADGTYRPTEVFDQGLAQKLGIPADYMRRLRTERPDLYDLNANGLLHGRRRVSGGQSEVVHPADERSFMLRLFRGEGGQGVARAMLSNSFGRIDNLDVLTAALLGIKDSGTQPTMDRCDITDRRMYVRVSCPEISMHAPTLLRNYRSPFSGSTGADNPLVFAGFIITNSETGFGAASIVPSITVQICTNGMTLTKDAVRAVHLGSRMDDGVVSWSEDTQRKQLALITARARDAVKTFLNREYMEKVIRGLEDKAQVGLSEPKDQLQKIGKALSFDQGTIDGVLDHFIRGGDCTAGGVLHAVTSFAQTVEDADKAWKIETSGIRALELAAASR